MAGARADFREMPSEDLRAHIEHGADPHVFFIVKLISSSIFVIPRSIWTRS